MRGPFGSMRPRDRVWPRPGTEGKSFALIRDGAARDRVAVIDAESLALRCTRPLAQGVRHGGLLLGRSRVYAYGVRRVERGRWDAVVTVSDLRDGALLGTRTLRQSTRGGGSKDWFVYWAALSEDERRLVLSYHGSNTTGADSFRVSPRAGVSHPGLKRGTDSPWTHGAVTAVGGKFISATGTGHLRELDRNGRVTRRLVVEARKTHLMDFAIDRGRRLVYVSSCGRNPAIQRVELAGAGRDTVSSGRFCGTPLAVHADRYLVLDARRVGKLGYPGTRPEGLRLLDLTNPAGGTGYRIPRPRDRSTPWSSSRGRERERNRGGSGEPCNQRPGAAACRNVRCSPCRLSP